MAAVACYVAVPIAAFRVPRAREYFETLPVPPPATVYGMLLSAIGEPDRLAHQGAELAMAVLDRGTRTRVLRTVWRVKDKDTEPGLGENKRPDFQELLVGARLAVHVRDGDAERRPGLASRLEEALRHPASVHRFGGLALGESTHLVDELRLLRDADLAARNAGWLVQDPDGPLALPVWPDHVGSERTRYAQFSLFPATDLRAPPDVAWVTVLPAAR